jgi:thiosulfate reductase cytochrome b subunit
MAQSAYLPGLAIQASDALESPRHSAIVRITHWTFSISFIGLVVSGVGILLSHPHFYWGETGGIGTPSLFDLPRPTVLGGPSGWGRSLHFQSAWLALISGLLYALSGLFSQHFRYHLRPSRADLSWPSLRATLIDHLRFKRPVETNSYNVLQRLSYLAVIFLFFPLIIITGFAMSPAITSVFPQFVTVFGGHQTARTLHFFLGDLLVLFLLVHIAIVILAGFASRMRAMITGGSPATKEPSSAARHRAASSSPAASPPPRESPAWPSPSITRTLMD